MIWIIKTEGSLGIPWWRSRLRIRHCHCCGSGHSCGRSLILGPGTSACLRCSHPLKMKGVGFTVVWHRRKEVSRVFYKGKKRDAMVAGGTVACVKEGALKKLLKYSWFTMLCKLLLDSKVIQLYIHVYIVLFLFLSIMVCHRILTIGPCAIQWDLAVYPSHMYYYYYYLFIAF